MTAMHRLQHAIEMAKRDSTINLTDDEVLALWGLVRAPRLVQMREALNGFVGHYPHGINPYLDAAYGMARDALAEQD